MIHADLKTYQEGGVTFAIAQVEVPGFAELEEAVEAINRSQVFRYISYYQKPPIS